MPFKDLPDAGKRNLIFSFFYQKYSPYLSSRNGLTPSTIDHILRAFSHYPLQVRSKSRGNRC
jgi:hypothetical protein